MENNYVREHQLYLSTSLLHFLGWGKPFHETAAKALQEVKETPLRPQYETDLQLLEEITEEAKKDQKLQSLAEDFQLYFGAGEESGHDSLSSFVLLFEDEGSDGASIEELFNKLETVPENAFIKRFLLYVTNYSNTSIVSNEISVDGKTDGFDGMTVIRAVTQMQAQDSVKLSILDMFMNRSVHREKCRALLEAAWDIILRFENPVNDIALRFYSYWNPILSEKGNEQFVAEYMPFARHLFKSILDITLNPDFFFPLRIAGSIKPDYNLQLPENEPFRIHFGILHSSETVIEGIRNMLSPETDDIEYDSCLKHLADKSRFAILQELHQGPRYGGELAKKLNLTTATVSHHMGLLFEANLITIERRENKVYYHLNHVVIDKVVAYLQHTLL